MKLAFFETATVTRYIQNAAWFALVALTFTTTSPGLSAQEPSAPTSLPSAGVGGQPFALGVGYVLHPLQLNSVNLQEQVSAIPMEMRNHVHLFMINGMDPLYIGNLNGLAAYCRSMGFTNTTCRQMTGSAKVVRDIKKVRSTDPDARIILLGYSFGANCARAVARRLESTGTRIDCLVYLGGDTVLNSPRSRPDNVGNILNINGHGFVLLGGDLLFKGDDIDGARNLRLDERHLLLPSRSDTIGLLGNELIRLALSPGGAEVPSVTMQRASSTNPSASHTTNLPFGQMQVRQTNGSKLQD